MPKSFAPSPIASVVTSGLSLLTSDTTSYFYLGETLQHNTALHLDPTAITLDDIFFLRPLINASPDIIKAAYFLELRFYIIINALSNASINYYSSLSSIIIYSTSILSKRQL